MSKPIIIVGPPTAKTSRKEAEDKLTAHPQFPKGAEYELDEAEGRWIAAIVTAAPPAFLDGGGAGDTPDGPPAPDVAPDGPPSPDDEAPSDDEPKEDDKPKEEKGEKGLEAKVEHLTELLTKVVDALGLGDQGPDDSPVPEPDGPPGPDELGPGPDGDSKTHTVHERALKPGEAPPGTTPVGAPSFAHVREDHPWKAILGKKKTFKIEEPLADGETLASAHGELKALAAETQAYEVEQLREDTINGQRVARCLVVAK